MKPRTLFDKIWDYHLINTQDDGASLIYIDRHLVHEVTSPQAFEGLRLSGRSVNSPHRTLAVADHNVPTTDRADGIHEEEEARDRRLPDVLPYHMNQEDKEHREGVEVHHHHVIRRLRSSSRCVHDARERVDGLRLVLSPALVFNDLQLAPHG